MLKKMLTLAFAVSLLVACGKKDEVKKPNTVKPASPTTPSSADSRKTFMEGNWSTNCFRDDDGDHVVYSFSVTDDIMSYSRERFSDPECTGPGQIKFQSFYRIELTAITGDPVYNHRIDYFNAAGVQVFEERVVLTSNGISLSTDEEKNVYIKR